MLAGGLGGVPVTVGVVGGDGSNGVGESGETGVVDGMGVYGGVVCAGF